MFQILLLILVLFLIYLFFVVTIISQAHICMRCSPLRSSSVDVTDVPLSLTSLMLDFIHAVVLDWLYWPAALTTHCTLC